MPAFDILDRLPFEVQYEVLTRGALYPDDLHRASLVCRRWGALVDNDAVWRKLAFQWGVVDSKGTTLQQAVSQSKMVKQDCTLRDLLSVVRTWRELVLLHDLLAQQLGRRVGGAPATMPLPSVNHIFSTLSHRAGGESSEIRMRRAFIQDRFLAAEHFAVLAEDNLAIFASNYHDLLHVDRWAVWVVDLQNSTFLWAQSSEEDEDVWGITAESGVLLVHHRSYGDVESDVVDVYKSESLAPLRNRALRRGYFKRRGTLGRSSSGAQERVVLRGGIAVGQSESNPNLFTFWDVGSSDLNSTRTVDINLYRNHALKREVAVPPAAFNWDGEYLVTCHFSVGLCWYTDKYHYPTDSTSCVRIGPESHVNFMLHTKPFAREFIAQPPSTGFDNSKKAMQANLVQLTERPTPVILPNDRIIGRLPATHFGATPDTDTDPYTIHSRVQVGLDPSSGTLVATVGQTLLLLRDYRNFQPGYIPYALQVHMGIFPCQRQKQHVKDPMFTPGPLAVRDGRAFWGPLLMIDFGAPLWSVETVRIFFLGTSEDTSLTDTLPSQNPQDPTFHHGPHSGSRNDKSTENDPSTYLEQEAELARCLRNERYLYRSAALTATGVYFLAVAQSGCTSVHLYEDDKRAAVVAGYDFAGGAMMVLNPDVCGRALAKRARLDLYKRVKSLYYDSNPADFVTLEENEGEWEDDWEDSDGWRA